MKLNELTLEIIKNVSIEVIARHLVRGFITGLHKSPLHGFSSTFLENREYVPGYPLKYLNWKAYARLNKLFVKRFEDETNMRVMFLVDVSSSMDFPYLKRFPVSKKFFSLLCAGSMAYFLREQNDAYGICLFSERVEALIMPSSGASHYRDFFAIINEHALKSSQNVRTSLSQTIHTISNVVPRRTMLVVFSDMFEEYASLEGLRNAFIHTHHRKHYLILFHVVDMMREVNAMEVKPGSILKDPETSNIKSINSASVVREYKEKISDLIKRIRLLASEMNIEYYLTDINEPPEKILLNFYLHRNRLVA